MILKFIKEEINSTREKDYETAIDIVTYELNNETYEFETENGVKVVFSYSSNYKSFEYLEPDFDSKSMDYVLHQSDRNENSEIFSIYLKVINPGSLLSVNEFLDIKKYKNSRDEYEANLIYGEEDIYLESLNPYLTKDELIKSVNLISSNNFQKENSYDLNLPINLEKKITEIIELNKNSIQNKKDIIIQNKNNFEVAKNTEINNPLLNEELFKAVVYAKDNIETKNRIKALIKQGANFSVENEVGDNALMVLIRKNLNISEEIMQFIVDHNEEYIEKDLKLNFNKKNLDGENILFLALKRNHNEIVKLILDNNLINLNLKNNKEKSLEDIAKIYNNQNAILLLNEKKQKFKP